MYKLTENFTSGNSPNFNIVPQDSNIVNLTCIGDLEGQNCFLRMSVDTGNNFYNFKSQGSNIAFSSGNASASDLDSLNVRLPINSVPTNRYADNSNWYNEVQFDMSLTGALTGSGVTIYVAGDVNILS